jgi:tetratricopeptide (TPR) repeat protein
MAQLLGFLQTHRSDRIARKLLYALEHAGPRGCVDRLLDETLRQRRSDPEHFGLVFAIGRASERIATEREWQDRTVWLERAVECYEAAVTLASQNQIRGWRLVDAVYPDWWDEGLTDSTQALLIASLAAGVLRGAEFRVRDPARAVEHLRRVTEKVRGYHIAWYYLGEAYLLDGRFDDAEAAWRTGLRQKPGDPAFEAVLANLPIDRVHHRVKVGDWPGVLAELARLPEGRMPASEALTIEGDAHLSLGKPDRARQSWEAALRVDNLAVGVRARLRKLDPSQSDQATSRNSSQQ